MALHERFRDIPGVNFDESKHNILVPVINFLIPEVHLVADSYQNLDTMDELHAQKRPGILIPRHIANVDGPGVYKMLVDSGHQEVADDTVNILGNKLKAGIFSPMSNAYPHIVVSPSSISVDEMTPEQKAERKSTNDLAKTATKEVFKRNGNIVLFAQGGREKGRAFKKFDPDTGGYLSMARDLVVFPIALVDTDKVLVPAPKGFDRIPRRHCVTMHVGEPIDVAELRKQYSHGTNEEVFTQRLQFIHDRLMEGQGKILRHQASRPSWWHRRAKTKGDR